MNRAARSLFALWIVIAGCAGSPQPCAADPGDTPVTLRDTTEVHSMIVRLSDVFNGISKDDDVAIARAPDPGKQVIYDVEVLKRVADKYQLDWKPKSIADHITITTACARLTGEMIRNAVATKAENTDSADGIPAHDSIEVVFDSHSPEIDLPTDKIPAFAIDNMEYDSQTKHFRADLVAQTPDGPASFPLTGRLVFKRNVPVLARQLDSGTVISAADIEQIGVPEEHINSSVIVDASQLIGHELRHDMDSDKILHAGDIVPPRFVTRGGLVILKIETPFMLLTAQGKALQDGVEGDVVRVTNTESNRVVEGTVDGPGVVRIQASQRVAEAQ